MCGRYAMAVDPRDLPEYFGQQNLRIDNDIQADLGNNVDGGNNYASYNIGPTRTAPVYFFKLNHDTTINHLIRYMKWGLIPFWSKKKSNAISQFKTFNARLESISKNSPLWRAVKSTKRCVIPIQGYYEWLQQPKKNGNSINEKIPFYIKRKDDKLIFLAGMYDIVKFEDTDDKDEPIYTYTIITGPAPNNLKWLHDRMPIILTPETKEFTKWLNPNLKNFDKDKLIDCLKPYTGNDLEWYKVSRDVGKMTSQGKYLIEPLHEDNKKDTIETKGIMNFFRKNNNQDIKKEEPIEEPIGQPIEKPKEEPKEEPKSPEKYQYKSRKSESPKKFKTESQSPKLKRTISDLGSGQNFVQPKWLVSPTGGWNFTPANWRMNTVFALVGFAACSGVLYALGEKYVYNPRLEYEEEDVLRWNEAAGASNQKSK
ncbi:hypothetical protein PACTADRAFT_4881 [Pachysolen tannophilus NRRL Y-2460]|uniref:DUF159 domain protein n=1 Tax=Pachysolen tannophilus NRRL Y-2460 TaxID=669874 RepID=A0A1E4TQN9_PACTA|nr:hypothetical protein PACTADRAFT_4881 [Pachysolen tannophilus NRRL Y-2460]